MSDSPKTLPEYIKWLKRAESKPHLYDNDEYIRIKKELYQAKKLRQLLKTQKIIPIRISKNVRLFVRIGILSNHKRDM